ncbi:hypothetical protein T484DRAFT_1797014 [Baffinella frigidus]|nr:hypothetical protein T484DRAFT_1797014 [Cryptophyta sp. CCMP2293]
MHLLSSKGAFEAGLLATLLLNPTNAAFAGRGPTAADSEPAGLIVPHGVPAVAGPHPHVELPAHGEEEPAAPMLAWSTDAAGGWPGRAAIGALAAAASMLSPSQRAGRRARGVLPLFLSMSPVLAGQQESSDSGGNLREGEEKRKGTKWVAHFSAAYAQRQRIILSCLVAVCIAGFYLYLIYLRQVVPIFHGLSLSLLVVFFGMLWEPDRGSLKNEVLAFAAGCLVWGLGSKIFKRKYLKTCECRLCDKEVVIVSKLGEGNYGSVFRAPPCTVNSA